MEDQSKQQNMLLVVLITVLLSAAVFGSLGYYLAKSQDSTKTTTAVPTTTSTSTATATTNPATDETANWKTYNNATYGFSFKYPDTWKVEDDNKGNINLTDTKKAYTLEESEVAPIVVQYTKDTSSGSIDTYLTGGRAPLKSILESDTTTLGGKTAYVLRGVTGSVFHNDRLIFTGGNLISFGAIFGDADLTEIFDTILTTVTFTK